MTEAQVVEVRKRLELIRKHLKAIDDIILPEGKRLATIDRAKERINRR